VIDSYLPVFVALLAAAAADDAATALFFTTWIGLTLLQFIVLQGATGFTLGKWLVGIRVVDANGLPPGILAALKRNLPLLLEWTTLIALVAMWRSPNAQRLGDRWAGTYVVRSPRLGAAVVQPRLVGA
jgi:uncharacterized RDD family membrane protein YckC